MDTVSDSDTVSDTYSDTVIYIDDICSICLVEIDSYSKHTAICCKNNFHKECYYKWVHESYSCPLCRKEVEQKEPIMPNILASFFLSSLTFVLFYLYIKSL